MKRSDYENRRFSILACHVADDVSHPGAQVSRRKNFEPSSLLNDVTNEVIGHEKRNLEVRILLAIKNLML